MNFPNYNYNYNPTPMSTSGGIPIKKEVPSTVREKIQTLLLLRFHPLGCLVDCLQDEYQWFYGEEISPELFGFDNWLELLASMMIEVKVSSVNINGVDVHVVHGQPLGHRQTKGVLCNIFDPNNSHHSNDPFHNHHHNQVHPTEFKQESEPQRDLINQTDISPSDIFIDLNTCEIRVKQESSDINSNSDLDSNASLNSLADASDLLSLSQQQQQLQQLPPLLPPSQNEPLDLPEEKYETEAELEIPERREKRERSCNLKTTKRCSPSPSSSSSLLATVSVPPPSKKRKKVQSKLSSTKSSRSRKRKKSKVAAEYHLSQSLPKLFQVIEKELSSTKKSDRVEQAWLDIFSMTIVEPGKIHTFVTLQGMDLFFKCLEEFPDEATLYEYMLGALSNMLTTEELRFRFLHSTRIVQVLYKLLESSTLVRNNFKIEFSIVEVLIHFLSDGPSRWRIFSHPSRPSVCDIIHKIIVERWDVGNPLIATEFVYNSLDWMCNLQFNSTAVCQLWSAWTLANFTIVSPDIYVSKLREAGGEKVLKSTICAVKDKQTQKYAQLALDQIKIKSR